jgi:hypothetical protein
MSASDDAHTAAETEDTHAASSKFLAANALLPSALRTSAMVMRYYGISRMDFTRAVKPLSQGQYAIKNTDPDSSKPVKAVAKYRLKCMSGWWW